MSLVHLKPAIVIFPQARRVRAAAPSDDFDPANVNISNIYNNRPTILAPYLQQALLHIFVRPGPKSSTADAAYFLGDRILILRMTFEVML